MAHTEPNSSYTMTLEAERGREPFWSLHLGWETAILPAMYKRSKWKATNERPRGWRPKPWTVPLFSLSLLVKHGQCVTIHEGQYLRAMEKHLDLLAAVPEIYGWYKACREVFIRCAAASKRGMGCCVKEAQSSFHPPSRSGLEQNHCRPSSRPLNMLVVFAAIKFTSLSIIKQQAMPSTAGDLESRFTSSKGSKAIRKTFHDSSQEEILSARRCLCHCIVPDMFPRVGWTPPGCNQRSSLSDINSTGSTWQRTVVDWTSQWCYINYLKLNSGWSGWASITESVRRKCFLPFTRNIQVINPPIRTPFISRIFGTLLEKSNTSVFFVFSSFFLFQRVLWLFLFFPTAPPSLRNLFFFLVRFDLLRSACRNTYHY